MLGMPLPPGMVRLLAMVPPTGMGLLSVMAPIWGMPLRLGTMSLLEMTPLPRIVLLPETASLSVVTPILGIPLRLGMVPLQEMAPLRGMVLPSGTVSLLKMMFQRVEAQNHQGQTSLAYRMTPAEH
jgi:hypothetical protein